MRIVDLMKAEAIALGMDIATKDDMLEFLIGLHEKAGNITDRSVFKEGILEREAEGPTAVTDGICIPHSKNRAVKQAGIAVMSVPAGVDCGALDGEPSKLFFMIAAPESGADIHLEALSRLSVLLVDKDFREKLLHASSPEKFIEAVNEKETDRFGRDTGTEEKPVAETKKKKKGFFGVFGR